MKLSTGRKKKKFLINILKNKRRFYGTCFKENIKRQNSKDNSIIKGQDILCSFICKNEEDSWVMMMYLNIHWSLLQSMVNFLLDPTGDIPWEEETGAEDVVHVESPKAFYKMLRKQKQPMLVMFYAPCKSTSTS